MTVLELVEQTTSAIRTEFVNATEGRRQEIIDVCLGVFDCVALLQSLFSRRSEYEVLMENLRVLVEMLEEEQATIRHRGRPRVRTRK